MPHSRGETVTQISSFTSQRYKVLWGLAKSDNIPLPREVSFDSPPNFYTLPEHWSWGHPKGWWNPQASLLKNKNKTTYFLCTQDHPKAWGERIHKWTWGLKDTFSFPNEALGFLSTWRHSWLKHARFFPTWNSTNQSKVHENKKCCEWNQFPLGHSRVYDFILSTKSKCVLA